MSRLVDKVEQTKALNLENSNLKLIGYRVRLQYVKCKHASVKVNL